MYKFQAVGVFFCLLNAAACSNTKLSQTWSDPEFTASYKDIMIVGVAQSEQLRRAYETYFSNQLRDRGVQALASYKLINHESEQKIGLDKGSFRNIVASAIKGSEIDAVLITHLVSIEEEDIYRPSMDYRPVYGPAYGPTFYSAGYYNNMYGYQGYVTTYVQQPGYFTHEQTYILETSLYDVESEELVWATRSRTFAPESMDYAIKELTGLIIDDLVSRKIIH